METHPDLNPGDLGAAARFRAVHTAYETLMASDSSASGPAISFTFGPFDIDNALASFLAVRNEKIVVGASNGRVSVIDATGQLTETHFLGKHYVHPAALHEDGSLAAAWCDGGLFFFSGGSPTSSFEMEGIPYGLVPIGEDIAVWHGNKLQIVSRSGSTMWEADFARNIVHVQGIGNELVWVAGAVMVFQRTVS